jgi:hypothetical protein
MQPESSRQAAVTAIANFSDVSLSGILDFQSKAIYSKRGAIVSRHDSTFTSHIIAEIDNNSSARMVVLHCGRLPVSFLPQVLEQLAILRQ